MKRIFIGFIGFMGVIGLMGCSGGQRTDDVASVLTTPGNPYLPLWEHIPDGEPYVFEDPDQPGKYRVYIYGSHDSMITEYCGRELVVWSAAVDSLPSGAMTARYSV